MRIYKLIFVAVLMCGMIIGGLYFIRFSHTSAKPPPIPIVKNPVQPLAPIADSTTTTVVKKVSLGNMPQLGIDIDWYVSSQSETSQEVSQQVTSEMNYITSLHANSVDFSFPFYMQTSTSNRVMAGSGTPTPHQLSIAIRIAVEKGLRVTLRPLLDEQNLSPKNWRGSITPLNVSDWFHSYGVFLEPYLEMAQVSGVSTFIIGAELNSLASSPNWESLIRLAKASFNGQLGYSANWDVFHAGLPNPPVNRLGVDAYFPVSNGVNATKAQLEQSWNQWWSTVPSNINLSKVVIDEVGISAQPGAYLQPYSTYIPHEPLDLAVQVNWFAAACKIVHERRLAGIYFWSVVINPSQSFLEQPTSFIGRPGQSAVKDCFASFS